MEIIINIITNAENSFIDWMIFISFMMIAISAILGAWCWAGEKINNKFNLSNKLDKFLEDEQY